MDCRGRALRAARQHADAGGRSPPANPIFALNCGAAQLRVYVALGRLAYESCWRLLAERGVAAKPRPAFTHGAVYRTPAATMVASYHPSRQNTHTGRLTPAMLRAVFCKARAAAGKPS